MRARRPGPGWSAAALLGWGFEPDVGPEGIEQGVQPRSHLPHAAERGEVVTRLLRHEEEVPGD